MDGSKKMLLGVLTISVFVFTISLTSLYVQMTIESGDVCGCIIPLPFFIPFVGSVGLFIGTLVYYLFHDSGGTMERQDTSPLLRLLEPSESVIVKTLATSGGSLYQSALRKETGLQKVKLSRLLDRMEGRGIIKKEQRGKSNMLTLSSELMELFQGIR